MPVDNNHNNQYKKNLEQLGISPSKKLGQNFIFDKNILNYKSTYPGRISSLFGDELILGSYISKFYPLFFYLHIKKFGYQGKLIYLLLISVATYFF